MGGVLETSDRGLKWENYGRGFADYAPVGLTYGAGFALGGAFGSSTNLMRGAAIDAGVSGVGGMADRGLHGGNMREAVSAGGQSFLLGGGMVAFGRAIGANSLPIRVGLGAGGSTGLAWAQRRRFGRDASPGITWWGNGVGGLKGEQEPTTGPSRSQWFRTRLAAATFRMGVGMNDVPGLSGKSYTPSIPMETSSMLAIDNAERTVGGAGLESAVVTTPAASSDVKQTPPQAPARWQTVKLGDTPIQPDRLPVIVKFTDPVDAALAPNAQYQVGSQQQIGAYEQPAAAANS